MADTKIAAAYNRVSIPGSSVNEEPVASLTMNLDLAKELVAKLQQMTNQIEE